MAEGEKLAALFARPAGDEAALEESLSDLMTECRVAWPGVNVDVGEFLRHVATCIPPEADVVPAVDALNGTDLFLAFACAKGDARAIRAFEDRFLPEVAGYVATIDRSPAFVDEVRQALREKLLVVPAGAEPGTLPKISEYTGRGALGAWLRVSSVRTALNMRRGVKREVQTPETRDTPDIRAPGVDPELDYLKTRYAAEFKEVFKTTLGALSADERTVLRMHYIDGLTLDQVAVAYRVHRATAARWLAQSREKIVEETKRLLQEKLKAKPEEIESLLGIVRSQLDVSIYRFLGKDGD